MNDKEKDRIKSFRSGHVCPDRDINHGLDFSVKVLHSKGTGIGENTYIECERCGCKQDITDYEAW